MRRAIELAAVMLALVMTGSPAATTIGAEAPAKRIVSLIPAVTEMLFAVGAGPQLIGVSSFDEYPPEVTRLEKVGGLMDPNTERILTLAPDLVIVYDSQTDLREQLRRAGIPVFLYKHGGLADVTSAIRAIAARVGRTAEGARVAADIDARLATIRARTSARPRPRTLLVFGREPRALRNIYASGGVGFLHDLLVAAGGDNVFAEVPRQSVQASTEVVLVRAPDVIIELRYGEPLTQERILAERDSWNRLAAVPAVRNARVHILVGDEFVVPGPRIVEAAERFARTLHPELR